MTSAPKTLVIGLGTGRCGTKTLAAQLDAQTNALVTHEAPPPLAWTASPKELDTRLEELLQRDAAIVGDVAFYYLPHAPRILETYPQAKMVCLRRDRAETVRSYLRKVGTRNHWIAHDGTAWTSDPVWDACYPKYALKDRAQAIGRYFDEYYAGVEELVRRHPERVRLWSMDRALNSRDGLTEVLDFVGIPRAEHVVQPKTRTNASSGLVARLFKPLRRRYKRLRRRDGHRAAR